MKRYIASVIIEDGLGCDEVDDTADYIHRAISEGLETYGFHYESIAVGPVAGNRGQG